MGPRFRVSLTADAVADTNGYSSYLANEQQASARVVQRWLEGLEAAVAGLEYHPTRCPLIPEQRRFRRPIRQVLYYSHRIIFTVNEEQQEVIILRVYHSARRPIQRDDLFQ